jgi:ankyrin repeat protein
LHYAALLGFHHLTSFLVIECSQDVNAKDFDYNWTPLHVASRDRHGVFARLLVQHGADVNALDVDKSTPLHLASKGGHVEFAQVLIEHGADVNAEGNYKWTPLHLASRGARDLADKAWFVCRPITCVLF